ncbi:MAG: DNA primase [Candidatus Woykebacteria bacterium]
MENEIEEIKQRSDIVSLISGYVPLKKTGRNYKGLCPFHSEKTPSFVVSPDRQIFKCFGCNEGGDVFAFVKKIDGVEFADALKKLAARAGITLKKFNLGEPDKKKEKIFSANRVASELFHYLLMKHKAGKIALDYLYARKINDAIIKKFQLGFAPEREVVTNFLLKKGFVGADLTLAGLVLPKNGRLTDRFRGRITFPIKDIQGRVLGFSARALGSREPKYLNSPDTPVFNKSNSLYGIDLAKEEIRKQKTAILVEGNLDVLSSHQVGVTNVVAPLGTALTERQVDILARFSESVLIGFDTDIAGVAAAKRGIEIAESKGLSVKVIDLGTEKDPDEIIKKDPTLWKKKIKEAVPVYDFVIISALRKWSPDEVEGKKQILKEVVPFIVSIQDAVTKEYYVRKISASLKVSEEALRLDLKKYSGREDTVEARGDFANDRIEAEDKLGVLEKYLLALILQTGILPDMSSEELNDPNIAKLFTLIKEHYKREGAIRLKKLSVQIPEELSPTYDEVILYEIDEKILDQHELSQSEISSCVARIKELNLRSKLRRLGLEIKQAEAISESQKIRALTEEFRDLSLQLSQYKSSK